MGFQSGRDFLAEAIHDSGARLNAANTALRDTFAGIAMSAWLPLLVQNSENGEISEFELAKLSYRTAEAMMAEKSTAVQPS